MAKPSEKASKVYTRTGDKGKTSLIGGARVDKSDSRLEAYGTVDELNSVIGVLLAEIGREVGDESDRTGLEKALSLLQHELFNIGSRLACEDKTVLSKMPEVHKDRISQLETWMDQYSENLVPLKNFILPGGSAAAAHAHIARTVCRRAERACVRLAETTEVEDVVVQLLNRMSDYFFVLARHLNRLRGIDEPVWKSNAT